MKLFFPVKIQSDMFKEYSNSKLWDGEAVLDLFLNESSKSTLFPSKLQFTTANSDKALQFPKLEERPPLKLLNERSKNYKFWQLAEAEPKGMVPLSLLLTTSKEARSLRLLRLGGRITCNWFLVICCNSQWMTELSQTSGYLWTYNSKSWVMFPIVVGWIHLKCYKTDKKDIPGGRNLEFHQMIMW